MPTRKEVAIAFLKMADLPLNDNNIITIIAWELQESKSAGLNTFNLFGVGSINPSSWRDGIFENAKALLTGVRGNHRYQDAVTALQNTRPTNDVLVALYKPRAWSQELGWWGNAWQESWRTGAFVDRENDARKEATQNQEMPQWRGLTQQAFVGTLADLVKSGDLQATTPEKGSVAGAFLQLLRARTDLNTAAMDLDPALFNQLKSQLDARTKYYSDVVVSGITPADGAKQAGWVSPDSAIHVRPRDSSKVNAPAVYPENPGPEFPLISAVNALLSAHSRVLRQSEVEADYALVDQIRNLRDATNPYTPMARPVAPPIQPPNTPFPSIGSDARLALQWSGAWTDLTGAKTRPGPNPEPSRQANQSSDYVTQWLGSSGDAPGVGGFGSTGLGGGGGGPPGPTGGFGVGGPSDSGGSGGAPLGMDAALANSTVDSVVSLGGGAPNPTPSGTLKDDGGGSMVYSFDNTTFTPDASGTYSTGNTGGSLTPNATPDTSGAPPAGMDDTGTSSAGASPSDQVDYDLWIINSRETGETLNWGTINRTGSSPVKWQANPDGPVPQSQLDVTHPADPTLDALPEGNLASEYASNSAPVVPGSADAVIASFLGPGQDAGVADWTGSPVAGSGMGDLTDSQSLGGVGQTDPALSSGLDSMQNADPFGGLTSGDWGDGSVMTDFANALGTPNTQTYYTAAIQSDSGSNFTVGWENVDGSITTQTYSGDQTAMTVTTTTFNKDATQTSGYTVEVKGSAGSNTTTGVENADHSITTRTKNPDGSVTVHTVKADGTEETHKEADSGDWGGGGGAGDVPQASLSAVDTADHSNPNPPNDNAYRNAIANQNRVADSVRGFIKNMNWGSGGPWGDSGSWGGGSLLGPGRTVSANRPNQDMPSFGGGGTGQFPGVSRFGSAGTPDPDKVPVEESFPTSSAAHGRSRMMPNPDDDGGSSGSASNQRQMMPNPRDNAGGPRSVDAARLWNLRAQYTPSGADPASDRGGVNPRYLDYKPNPDDTGGGGPRGFNWEKPNPDDPKPTGPSRQLGQMQRYALAATSAPNVDHLATRMVDRYLNRWITRSTGQYAGRGGNLSPQEKARRAARIRTVLISRALKARSTLIAGVAARLGSRLSLARLGKNRVVAPMNYGPAIGYKPNPEDTGGPVGPQSRSGMR